MYSSKPTIATSAKTGGATPDGTYQNRCFQGGNANDSQDDRLLTVDVDQIGSGTAGDGLVIMVRTRQFADPFEQFRGVAGIGNE